jgi:predicted Zn-dependent protease
MLYWQAKAFLALSQRAFTHLQSLPQSSESHQTAALEHEKHSRYPEAAASWKNALELEPTDPQLELRLALALCHGNDCATALPLLKNQLLRQPDSAELNYFCGLALTSTRTPSEALSYLERSVKRDPKFLAAQAALGEAYLEANQPANAIEHLKASLADDPDGSRHYQLARAYRAAGLQPQATATLSAYREILQHRRTETDAQISSITPP